MRGKTFEISRGFFLGVALLLYLDTQWLVPQAMVAAALHELGHYVAVRGLGGHILRFRLTATGGEMILDPSFPLNKTRELIAILAGPGTNLLIAWVTSQMGWYVCSGIHFTLGIFNLLPIYPLDGGRSLRLLLSARPWGEAIGGGVGWATLIGLGALSVKGMRHYGLNGTLVGMGIWLGWNLIKRGKSQKKYEI